ncbi:MAG TPA: UDP-3-O-acyl-N-acetylglucosamine deacetylase [Vicinamibacteria bacterium]|nr:UDP-3-O-acyl-N-acetylglucosamine deacetylase [Vicinamibacteria bacterium]
MIKQTTLRYEASCVGIGLHSGRKVTISLKPARAGTGIVFRRSDVPDIEIPATSRYLSHINHATCLARDGICIETVEHLLASFNALGVDNVVVELDGPEVPIMDGSASPFVYLIHEAGIRKLPAPRRFLKLRKPVSVAEGGRFVAAYPCDSLRLSYTINFDHPLIRHQELSIEVDESSFCEQVAPARTFGFMKEVELMRQSGLALGGSLDNAIVLGETGVLNNPLRFPNEFVRHKILDLLGDLVLLGRPLLAHVVALRAGHALHTKLVEAILNDEESWELASGPEAELAAAKVSAPALARTR